MYFGDMKMSFWANLFGTPAVKTQPVEHAPGWMLDDARNRAFDIPDGSLLWHQADLYQRLSWVQAAVSAVAQTAAVVPFSVKRIAGEQRRDIPNHPFELLLARPNPLQSRFEFLESVFSYRALIGNAYVWLNRADEHSAPSEMWVIPSYKIKPIPDGRLYLAGYEYDTGSGFVTLPAWQVVHFKRFHPLNQFVGLSPIEALATVAVGDLKAQEYNTNFFGEYNAKVPGALAFADNINDSDWKQIKADVKTQNGGVRRSLMMRNVGQKGVQWVQMGMSQSDMQFLEGRTFTKEEIYSIFAPGLSSVLAVNATEANAASGKGTFVEFAVWPALVAVAEKLTNDVLPAYDRRSALSLVGCFDDIRPKNRELELKEMEMFARFHSVDEVRAKFYGSAPMGAAAVGSRQ